jgi:hypothetical protein
MVKSKLDYEGIDIDMISTQIYVVDLDMFYACVNNTESHACSWIYGWEYCLIDINKIKQFSKCIYYHLYFLVDCHLELRIWGVTLRVNRVSRQTCSHARIVRELISAAPITLS